MNNAPKPADYATLPLELWTVTDLTDALSVETSAKLLRTTKRAVYTIRNTNVMSLPRTLALIEAVRSDEERYRRQLIVMRNAQHTRAAKNR